MSNLWPKLKWRLERPLRRVRGKCHSGYCSICERTVSFEFEGPWLRDQYKCSSCHSIPRWRALMEVIAELYPGWRDLAVHESSPGGALSKKLAAECKNYIGTQFFPGIKPGAIKDGFRCEDITRQTFNDESFDLVVTSDVFEHVFNADCGFREIARTLKPGGAHIFTVPWFARRPTLVRAIEQDGKITHLQPPDYHGNPIDANGSLVITEWGRDLPFSISTWTRLPVAVYRQLDKSRGLLGEFIEVFVCQKPETIRPEPKPAAS